MNNELFRLLNEDFRYELVSLNEDATTWSAAYNVQDPYGEKALPLGLARLAQTSAFVHIRVLYSFLYGHVDSINEYKPSDFNVQEITTGTSPNLEPWIPAINSNVLHLNKRRPSPEILRRSNLISPPTGVQHEVERLANEVALLWRSFVGCANMKPYRKLTDHIADDASDKAERVRCRLAQVLGIPESQIPRRPPLN